MSTADNIARMSEKLPQLCQDHSREFAKRAVEANPKLVEKYFSGKSALGEIVGWAMAESRGSINPSLTGEWCVVLLEEIREKRLEESRKRT